MVEEVLVEVDTVEDVEVEVDVLEEVEVVVDVDVVVEVDVDVVVVIATPSCVYPDIFCTPPILSKSALMDRLTSPLST